MTTVQEQFGDIDIYVFDQLLRGRITNGMRVFDAGCGSGRNIAYLLREGLDVRGVDMNADAIAHVRGMTTHPEHFQVEPLEAITAPNESADVVICSAVLHFARDDAQFNAMLLGAWRVLKPGGVFFCRLASDIGMERRVERIEGRRFRLPDGSTRYLVDEALLLTLTERLNRPERP